jgi:murein DD-endopeptidase MepM/ murein hydrolase activator NlpD
MGYRRWQPACHRRSAGSSLCPSRPAREARRRIWMDIEVEAVARAPAGGVSMNGYQVRLPRWALLLLVGCLALALMPAAPARAAPAGHRLPFDNADPVLEWPGAARNDEDDAAMRSRDAEGILLGLPVLTPVLASAPGTVVFAGWQSAATGYQHCPLGVVIHVRHTDGTLSEYGHLNDPDVWVGKWVERGEFIAHSGMTGATERPALYFAILVGTTGAGFDGRSVSLRGLPGLDLERGVATGAGVVSGGRNLAVGRPAWASSEESDITGARFAVDGNPTTRYSSGHRSAPEELAVDLGGRQVVSRVVVRWETARPQTWRVFVFAPMFGGPPNWREVWATGAGEEEATFAAVEALGVKVVGEDHWRAGWSNLSIWELEAYGL